MFLNGKLQRRVLPLVLFATIVLVPSEYGRSSTPPDSPRDGQHIGKMLSVRRVLRNRYFTSRYPQIHYYQLYFSVRVADQTFCSEYETPVLDEIRDVFSARDKDVEFALKGKNLTLRTPGGRIIKTHLVEGRQC